MDIEQTHATPSIDGLYKIGSHMAAADTLDEVLSSVVDFATTLVKCDSCLTYVRQGEELVLWVWKHSDRQAVDRSNLPLGRGITAFLAEHRIPIGISSDASESSQCKLLNQSSMTYCESSVSVPLLSRGRLVGIINLRHRQPHAYSMREIKLLSNVGFLVGAEIGIACLESENSELRDHLETRKLVERGKGILQRELGLTEEQAYLLLQRHSREKRKPMKEIAEAVILGHDLKCSYLTN
jgi:signal transduction protein with GAF and PtsI domain